MKQSETDGITFRGNSVRADIRLADVDRQTSKCTETRWKSWTRRRVHVQLRWATISSTSRSAPAEQGRRPASVSISHARPISAESCTSYQQGYEWLQQHHFRVGPLSPEPRLTGCSYGQTGSGKSFTMVSTDYVVRDCAEGIPQTGVQNELGIIPCSVDGVFDAITAVSHLLYATAIAAEPAGPRTSFPTSSLLH